MRITRLFAGALAPFVVVTSTYAGEPAPQAPATAAEQGAAETPTSGAVTLGPKVRDAQGREGRIHTVVAGDTLWAISGAYLGSPLKWPSVWTNNPAVKDPHWIYPGNQIWISDTEMRPLTSEEAAAVVPIASTSGASEDASPHAAGSLGVPNMERIGVVEPGAFESAGAVLGSPEGEKWLGAHRRVWVSLGEGQVHVGDRFTVVRESERVRDPETHDVLGVYVQKLGWLEITKVGPESSDAMIRVSTEEMERGDRLIPRIEPALEVPVRTDVTPVEGQLALLPDQRTIMGQQDWIFLNRGTDDGLEIGASLEVFRPGAVVKDHETRLAHVMPDESVANLVVVSAQPRTAVAIATHATQELARGDRFRTASDTTTSYRESSLPMESTQWTARNIDGRDAAATPGHAAPAKAAPPAAPKR